MHSCLALSLAPHFKKIAQLRESAEARQALARGKFREALRETDRISEIAAACRDDGMICAATYFRSSVLALSGLWDQELSHLCQLHARSSSPHFPEHFRTAVALLKSSAELKCSGTSPSIPSVEQAAAAGML
jgi:hypothetical protein